MLKILKALGKYTFVLTFIYAIEPSAPALNAGPRNYYVVQSDMTVDVVDPKSKKTVKLTLHRGQFISLEQLLLNFELPVEATIDGKLVKTKVSFRAADVRRKFGPPLNPSHKDQPDQFLTERPFDTGLGRFLRLDKTPYALDQHPNIPGNTQTTYLPEKDYPPENKTGGTKVSILQSKVIELGQSDQTRLTLVHYICLEPSHFSEKCGWITNDLLSRGDQPVYNWHSADAQGEPSACDRRDSLGRASRFASEMLNAINHLPKDEQNAREQVRSAVGTCALNPANLPYWLLPTQKFTAKNENLYQGLARPTAEKAYAAVAASASKVIVRGAPGQSSHPLSKEEFVTIDAFARTLYGEMRDKKCSRKPYMEATARTIINRAYYSKTDPSSGLDHGARFRRHVGSAKHPILQAIVSDQAYSMWNNDDEIVSKRAANARRGQRMDDRLKNHLLNTETLLCPASNQLEQDAWQRAVDIAMHAVLDSDQFLRETKGLEGIRYFTSGVQYGSDYKKLNPQSLDGLTPSKGTEFLAPSSKEERSCMTFWKANDE